MKIWLKIVFGLIIGIALGFLLPISGQAIPQAFSFISLIVLRVGRSLIVPLFFFSAALAIYQLHEDKQTLRMVLVSSGVSLAFTAGLSLFGVISVLAFNPARIPIPAETPAFDQGFTLKEFFLRLFPDSMFDIFLSSGFLLPAFFLAVIVGMVLSAERANAKPAILLFDSLSHISYHLNNYFSEFLAFGVIFLSADGIFQLRAIADPLMYRGLVTLVLVDTLLVALVAIPAALYFSCGRRNPYKHLYALLAPALTGLFSGDVNFSLGILYKHSKESLGIRRRANSLSATVATLVGRAGSSMIATVSFLIIIKSYSSLGISPLQILWVLGASMMVSLVLGAAPGTGSITAIIFLCSLFGRGFETGYLIVKPIAWPLIASGALLDILVAGSTSLISARLMGMQEEKESRFYI
jgi:Na+/H+-dicarboxylate symporter